MRLATLTLDDRILPSVNPIVAENLLPGTPQSVWDVSGAGDPTIQGFATDISVNQGQTVSFKIDDTAVAPFHIDIFRLGFYQGLGARLVSTIPSSQTIPKDQPNPLIDQTTKLVDAGNWTISASWTVPANATSGIYIARVARNDTGGASHIPFIVRSDSGHSALLFQTSDSTWQAYNTWGGYSLYEYTNGIPGPGPSGGGAVAVSYNRPLIIRGTPGGLGSYNSAFHAEYPMVRWLESNGYDVSYFTDVDSDRNGTLIKNHQVFLSVGHDEYWSGGQRANVEAARDAGVNLAFFSGNEVFWKSRWQNSIDVSATPYRTLVTYKETKSNDRTDPLDLSQGIWTGTWRDTRFSPPADGGRPENALTGTAYMNDRTSVDIGINMQVTAAQGGLRFWRNTSVAQHANLGQGSTVGDRVVGYETDEDLDNGFRPAGLMGMSSTTFTTTSHIISPWGTDSGPGTSTHTITLYRAPSGALVFGAGTVQWSWGLDGTHDNGASTPDLSMQQATVNLFGDMNVQPGSLRPGLVPATASVDAAPPTSAITTPANGANLQTGTPVTITGTATEVGGGRVAGVEVSVDGGQTWHPALGTTNWTYAWAPDTVGAVTLKVRAVDDSGNLGVPSAGGTVNVSYQPTSSTGLVAQFSFDQGSGATLTDSSGKGNNGTVSGATWVPGLFGQALSFDGVNDWVTVNSSTTLNLTTAMTLEAWVKPAALTDWSSLLMKERSSSGLSYAIYANNGVGEPPAGYVHSSTSDSLAIGASVLPLNAWSHLATTYDGSTLQFYVNGKLVGTQSASGAITTSTGALRIGGNSIWGEFFNGLIDQVRIYNRALNLAEIRDNMSTPAGGTLETTAPTVAVTLPVAGASLAGITTIQASASDNLYVAGVQFLLDGQPLGMAVTAAPYVLSWDTRKVVNGTHTISARAWDMAGNSTTSAATSVTVNNPPDVTAPAVQITHPPEGFMASGAVVLNAVASDNIGVASVRFRLDGVDISGSTDAIAPYRVVWDPNTVADGSHSLVAVATDLSGNVTSSNPISVSVDHTAATVVSTTPANNSTIVSTGASLTVTFSDAIQSGAISFVLRDPAGNPVTSTITYDDTTHIATLSHGTVALDPLTIYTATVSAADLAGNVTPPFSWSFSTGNAIVGATIWDASTVPALPSVADPIAIEVGVRFRSDLAGTITGLRFYKGPSNTGTHIGHLWTATGQLLAAATFTGETAGGWQQVNFATPVAISANTTYVASYFAPVGGYAANSFYFGSDGVDSGPLHALADGIDGGNGIYRYIAGGGFPNSTFQANNYWVDVVFSSNVQGTSPPTVTGESPPPNSMGVAQNTTVTATFSQAVQLATISIVLKDPAGNTVPAGPITYNSGTNTATLTPTVPLAATATYTATVSGAVDLSGNVMAGPFSWSFTTADPSAPPTVVATEPEPGETGVPKSTKVEVIFSKDVNPNSISFVLKDSAGNVIPSTMSYEGEDREAALTPNAALAALAAYTATVSGATDPSGNVMAAPYSWSFTTAGTANDLTLFGSATPAVAADTDVNAMEMGVKFRSDVSGYVTGVRFYKGPGNAGTHVGHLWTSTGTLLASVTFVGETASGWQQATFAAPVAVTANTTYVVSYFAPLGHNAYTSNYFASTGADSGALHAPSSPAAGGNGVYVYSSSGGFPTNTYNATNYWVDLLFSTSNADTTPPVVNVQSPGAGALPTAAVTAAFSESMQSATITGSTFTLKDAANNAVAATVTYSDATHTATLTPNAPLAFSTTYSATISGVTDLAGNALTSSITWSFTTLAPVINATLFAPGATPAVAADTDVNAIEMGVKFRSDVSGYVTGVRFYKGPGNAGTHVGHLWTSTGTLLASVTFVGETASGWQQATFAAPVAVTANTTYVVSYFAPLGHNAYTNNYFASTGADSGALHAPSSPAAGGNGVYAYSSSGGFPTNTYNATNYWVDLLFSTSNADTIPPTVIAQTPAAAATNVAATTIVVATFNESVQAATVTTGNFTLKDAANNAVAATVAYDGTTHTVTLTPTAPLAANTAYTAALSGVKDLAGNTMTGTVSWSFTTVAPIVNATLFAPGATPAVAADTDANAMEMGVKFRSDVSGYVTGVRFYKGPGNAGTHVGHLWTSTGTLLASVTFVGETASGWQQATFAAPVAVTANTTYVVSYFAPNGHNAYTSNYFASTGADSGALHAPSSPAAGGNGVYAYSSSGGFPTNTYNATNYWVDLLFSTSNADTAPPTVTSQSPAAGAADVLPTAVVTATFSEYVQPGSVTYTLKDGAGNAVAAAVAYDDSTHTATLTPSAPLAYSTTYTATVSGAKDLTGNSMPAAASWSFTTRSRWLQSTAADFNSGTPSGVVVTNSVDGEIQLAPSFADGFNGSSLGAAWTSSSWSSAGGGPMSITVTGGTLSLAGGAIYTTAAAGGSPVTARLNFGAAPYQHFGLVPDFNSNTWVLFSTAGTSNTLFARVNGAGSPQDVNLGALPSGFHVYQIKPVAGAYQFYVDGALLTTITATIPNVSALKVGLSSFNGATQPALQADWVRLDSYSTSGTFASAVYDAGRTAAWGAATWTASVPSGTTVLVETSSSADGNSWSGWSAVANGGTVASPSGRYLRYRITFTTTDPAVTASLSDITFIWS